MTSRLVCVAFSSAGFRCVQWVSRVSVRCCTVDMVTLSPALFVSLAADFLVKSSRLNPGERITVQLISSGICFPLLLAWLRLYPLLCRGGPTTSAFADIALLACTQIRNRLRRVSRRRRTRSRTAQTLSKQVTLMTEVMLPATEAVNKPRQPARQLSACTQHRARNVANEQHARSDTSHTNTRTHAHSTRVHAVLLQLHSVLNMLVLRVLPCLQLMSELGDMCKLALFDILQTVRWP